MPLSLGAGWTAGEKVKPSKLNAKEAAIIAKFAAGITSADISPTAGIQGGQLSSASGTRITNPNLENMAVDSRVLKSDTAAGHPTASVGRDHIIGAAINAEHYASGSIPAAAYANASVAFGKMNLTTYSHPGSISPLIGQSAAIVNTGLSNSTTRPIAIWNENGTGVNFAFGLRSQGGTWRVHILGDVVAWTLAANELKVLYLS